jgi:hypothetical protein
MMYTDAVLDMNIDMGDPALQSHKQSIYHADKPGRYREIKNDIIINIHNMDDLLPLLNSHIILESISMKSVARMSDNFMNRLIVAAYLYAFIGFHTVLLHEKFLRVYLRHVQLYTHAMKILKFNNYPGCDFINE